MSNETGLLGSRSHPSPGFPEGPRWPFSPIMVPPWFLGGTMPCCVFPSSGPFSVTFPILAGPQKWPSLWQTEVCGGDLISGRIHELRFLICETGLRVTTSQVGILWENAANLCHSLPPPLSEPVWFNQKCIINWTMEEWLVEIRDLAICPWLRIKPQIKKIKENERSVVLHSFFFQKLLHNYIASKLYN